VLTIFFALLVSGDGIAAPPKTYSGAPIRGRIVDAATGEPLAGAVIVAAWVISPTFHENLHGATKFKLIHLVETISDDAGIYLVPAWGPIERPASWEKYRSDDPTMSVFKPGFEPVFPLNVTYQTKEQTGPPFNSSEVAVLRSAYDGKDIALFRYGKGYKDWQLRNPGPNSIQLTPESFTAGLLENYASSLARNADRADYDAIQSHSPARLNAMRLQRRAVLLVDEELRKFGSRFHWPTGIDFLKRE